MISPTLGFWGGINFLAGNAKVYDGSFDEDAFIGKVLGTTADPLSILIASDFTPGDVFDAIYFSGENFQNSPSLSIIQENTAGVESVTFFIRESLDGSVSLLAAYPIENKKSIVIITYDGSRSLAGIKCYQDGEKLFPARTADGGISNFDYGDHNKFGRRPPNDSRYWQGTLKQFEIINRVATAQEIADAGNPSTGGSFRAAGIAHDSGEYLLAPNFDKTDGNPPTTFPDTPSYTITSFGGAEYVDYPSL